MKFGVGIGVAVLRGGRVLLGLRTKESGSDLQENEVWTLPGGKVTPSETLVQCVLRELEEETGLKARGEDLLFVSLSDDIIPSAHYVTAGFALEKFEGEPRALEPDEISEWKWFPLDELPKNLYFPSRKLLETLSRSNPDETNRAYYRA